MKLLDVLLLNIKPDPQQHTDKRHNKHETGQARKQAAPQSKAATAGEATKSPSWPSQIAKVKDLP